MQDSELDRLLAHAAAHPPVPSPDLMDRVLADALAAQPMPHRPAPARAPARSGLAARLAALFGGMPALASVSAAAVLGVALGYFGPITTDGLANGLTGAETEEFFPSVDFLTTEG